MSSNNLPSVSGYEIVKKLGEGSFGKVFLAVESISKKQVALKYCETSTLHRTDLAAICREVDIHRNLKHPQIVKFYESMQDVASITMVLEFVEGENLQTIPNAAGKLEEKYVGYIFKQIVSGLQYIHDESIVHLDLKPSNILVTDSNLDIKIADFGSSSRVSRGDLLYEGRTTRQYASPEVLFAACTGYDGEAADVWALGVMLFQMVTGDFPFPNARETMNITYIIPEHVSYGCSILLAGIFQEQEQRSTLSKIRTGSWIENNSHIDWNSDE